MSAIHKIDVPYGETDADFVEIEMLDDFRMHLQHVRRVSIRLWIAVCVYLMAAIVHKQLDLPGTLHRTLQLLSSTRLRKCLCMRST